MSIALGEVIHITNVKGNRLRVNPKREILTGAVSPGDPFGCRSGVKEVRVGVRGGDRGGASNKRKGKAVMLRREVTSGKNAIRVSDPSDIRSNRAVKYFNACLPARHVTIVLEEIEHVLRDGGVTGAFRGQDSNRRGNVEDVRSARVDEAVCK